MNDKKVAFLIKAQFEDESIRGAVLVTDVNTTPLEFRVTSVVKPDDLQKTLYGEILDEYICIELLALPLLNALKEKPDILVVQNRLFLDVNSKAEIPPIVLLSEAQVPADGMITEKLDSPRSQNRSLYISIPKASATNLNSAKELLSQIAIYRDLIEPLKRAEAACKNAHDRKLVV